MRFFDPEFKFFSADQIHLRGQDLISELSTTLNFVADIHLARHVDVDGVLRDGSFSSNEIYANTVEKARSLVRTLEASAQAAHDDGLTLLMTIQSISATKFWRNRNDKTLTYEWLDSLCLSLKANMDLVQKTLEGLLAVGHEQADTAEGEYNGSIEWRLSKVSMIHQSDNATYVDEDVVDMEYAMNGHSITISSLALGGQSENGQADSAQPDDPLYSDTKSIGQTDGAPFEPSPSPCIDDDSKYYLQWLSDLTQ
jgi:son of sevenless